MAALAAPAAIVRAGPETPGPGHYLRKFESMKIERLAFDRKWQLVSDYELPRREFTVHLRPNQLRPHRVTSSIATALGVRLAANVLASMIDPTRPNLLPNVKRGMVLAGRDTNLDDASINLLGDVAWTVFDRMMLPRAGLMQHLGAMVNEFIFFGCGVVFTGRKRGFGPVYNGRPLQACWWALNDAGEIDTLYFKLRLPLYRVFQRWPGARAVEGWREDQVSAGDEDEQALTDILIACEPRPGGRPGAVGPAKAFRYVSLALEKEAILEEGGYDSFPYSVFRYNPFPGAAYAEGPGCFALADVMVLNHLQQSVENIAEQKGQPPLAWPARMFPKPLDRRPGAANAYNAAGLGIQKASEAILKLDFTGDPGPVMQMIELLSGSIGRWFFEDLMKLRESGDMTAEEIVDRRGLRQDGMAGVVANCAQPMTVLGDRTLEGLAEERMLPKMTPALAGVDVDWEYAGPLAIAQLKGNVQATLQLIQARGLVAAQDPAAAQTVDLEHCLRTIQQGLGTPMSTINSAAKVQAAREQMARQQLAQLQAARAKDLAGAANDAGGAVASLAQAGQGAPQGPPGPAGAPGQAGPAGFAPANVLTSPLAA